jgi:VWFA-related protein
VKSGLVAAALVATVFAADAFLAQNPQPQPPTFRTEANYVRVDVYPTKDGMPVTDLTQDDFEVVEDRAPQKIEQFEHVVIRGGQPQETRVEPNTIAQSRSMVENSRARVFVVFLDTYHVDVTGSHNIRRPLVEALDRLIGPEDLVGVMTPEMAASDVTFARKTTTIDGFLTRYWAWGEKDRGIVRDKDDEDYGYCYPNQPQPSGPNEPDCTAQNGIAAEMIDRRHEKMTIEALRDLVIHLRGVREERKAILAISNGWLLYRPNTSLMRPLTQGCGQQPVPSLPPIGVDPRGGKLTAKESPYDAVPRSKCDIDRMRLAQIDDERTFKEILDEANAANASFYPIDPRGLPVFDTPIMRLDVPGPAPATTPLAVDAAMLRGRLESLRTLAENTDGIAIVNSNNLDAGFKRVVADLSAYYLLGYYSTGKLDGRFHSITVRVKRPGVQVRARRGYLAATPQAVNAAAATAAAAAADTAAAAQAHAIDAVLQPLNGFVRELPIRVQTVAGYTPRGPAAVWVVGELGAGEEWKAGAEADVLLTTNGGAASTLATAHVAVPIGAKTFRATLTPASPLTPGDYAVRVRARGADSSMSTNETAHVVLSAPPEPTGAIYLRRGLSTGNRETPTADLRFRRNEQLRVEMPAPADAAVTARLLDRTGKPLAVPVAATTREDADGTRWQSAQLALAPLAPGDYVIEISRAGGAGGATRTLAAFRVIP